jgi:hypothetical protein
MSSKSSIFRFVRSISDMETAFPDVHPSHGINWTVFAKSVIISGTQTHAIIITPGLISQVLSNNLPVGPVSQVTLDGIFFFQFHSMYIFRLDCSRRTTLGVYMYSFDCQAVHIDALVSDKRLDCTVHKLIWC